MNNEAGPPYDFFIAYAGNNPEPAHNFYNILSKDYAVFLDSASIQPGDNWTRVIPQALENSRAVLILLSKASGNAYYLGEEVQRAIQLQRQNQNWFKIIPIYLDGFPTDLNQIPYGLYKVQSIDFIKEQGSYQNVCLKLAQYASSPQNSLQDADRLKSQLNFNHVLHQYNIGPMVEGHLIPTSIIEAYAEFIEHQYRLQTIDEANAFRKSADPQETGQITIKKIKLPPPPAPEKEFWLGAFKEARLHGPRMLAALLLSVDDRFFEKSVITQKKELLEKLKNY
jgi:TIR domain